VSLAAAVAHAPQSQLPNFGPAFDRAGAGESAFTGAALARLQRQVQAIIQRAVTHSFREPLLLCAVLSLLALVPLAYGVTRPGRE
jgi:hypothetical protein